MSSRPAWRSLLRLFSRAALPAFCAALVVCFATSASNLRAQGNRSGAEHGDSRLDIYGGYGYLHPVNSGINGYQYHDIYNPNATASVTGWFNHYFGLQAEGSYFEGGVNHVTVPTAACGFTTCNQIVYTAQGGPAFRLPLGRFVPFAHALGGGERSNGPAAQRLAWGWGVTGGVGIDYVLPFLHDHLAIRPVQADFQYSQVKHGPLVLPAGIVGGLGEVYALKLSGGLVLRFGEKGEKQPVMLGCTAEPVSVHPGDTVTVTGSTLYLNPKRSAQYTWTANGGKITPSGPTATVDTAVLCKAAGPASKPPARHRLRSCPSSRPPLPAVLRQRQLLPAPPSTSAPQAPARRTVR